MCYLVHAGEPLLTLQSGGWGHLQAADGVQSERVQEQVLGRPLQPHGRPLTLQHGLRVGVGARGRGQDRGGRAGGARGARRPGGVAGTVLRREHASVARAAVFDVDAFTAPGVELSLHLQEESQRNK